MRNAGIAAVLSFLLPGLGQVYNGTFIRALFWFIFAGGLWIGSAGTLGWILHIWSAWAAYMYAQNHPTR